MAVVANAPWHFLDIFKLNKIEIEACKMEVARAMGIPWKTHLPENKAYALPVAGIEPISDGKIAQITAAFMKVKNNKAHNLTTTKENEWLENLGAVSCASTVINGLMADWSNGGMPFNKGYRPSHYHVSTMCWTILKPVIFGPC